MHSNHGFAAGALESADGADASAGTAGKAIDAAVGTSDDSLEEEEGGAGFTACDGALFGHSTSQANRIPT